MNKENFTKDKSLGGFIWISLEIGKKNSEIKKFKGKYVPIAQDGDFFLQFLKLFMFMIVILVSERESPSRLEHRSS